MIDQGKRELTYDERATFGNCKICGAKHGEWCNGDVGISLGRTVDGKHPEGGVHLGRIQEAPKFVSFVFSK